MYIRCFENDFWATDDMVIGIHDMDHSRTGTDDHWIGVWIPYTITDPLTFTVYSETTNTPYRYEYVVFEICVK